MTTSFAGIVFGVSLQPLKVYPIFVGTEISGIADVLDYFSELAPCGVIGAFLLDKTQSTEPFTFKHHYITGAIDSGVMAALFSAMREGRAVSLDNLNHKREEPRRTTVVPLRIFISVQNGRQHLLAYQYESKSITSFRIDYLSKVKAEHIEPRFAELRDRLTEMQGKMWGVNTRRGKFGNDYLEQVSFVIKIKPGEDYIVNRLYRERRIGRVEKIDALTYRFSAEVYDTWEMVPWIRSFISKIESLNFSNRSVENRFKEDVAAMYKMYGIGEEGDK